ncbi:MAG: hypothetical protein IPM39_05455 [Chloroflexi bacterium]|nr:hypothetical protein [Chloroflexota bacterium]
MGTRFRFLLGSLLAVSLIIILFFAFRPRGRADFGPATAVCPGPDQFGYTCTSADGYAYIDATQDTGLYDDDGIVTLQLPFPFTFYGTTYTSVQASSNGNLQFANGNPHYFNECLLNGPQPGMGDMIAPFWDDLDLTAVGFLETEVVGSAPNRVFVVEWDDVPRFGEGGDNLVTFAVHLLEATQSIAFLYEDVTTVADSNGRSATIGLQSEAAGISLQFGCNQPAVNNNSGLLFPFPEQPNPDIGRETAVYLPPTVGPNAKGEVLTLLTAVNQRGAAALPQLQRHWLSQTPQRLSEWTWADLDGNGRDELILLWRGPARQPQLSQLVVLTPDDDGQMDLMLDHRFSRRSDPTPQLTLAETADLTGDGRPDLLLTDKQNGYQFALTTADGSLNLLPLPDRCQGGLRLLTPAGSPVPQIIRDGCAAPGRTAVAWNGQAFTTAPTTTP